jgi:NADP-dependent 3-hydroxy acid dehydrogenase YdfG
MKQLIVITGASSGFGALAARALELGCHHSAFTEDHSNWASGLAG